MSPGSTTVAASPAKTLAPVRVPLLSSDRLLTVVLPPNASRALWSAMTMSGLTMSLVPAVKMVPLWLMIWAALIVALVISMPPVRVALGGMVTLVATVAVTGLAA